ncbi:MAG: GrpB family protein [Betaproteobacteria bacterium]|nr:GrpB family protein [Betaproteobacteria bacterium]
MKGGSDEAPVVVVAYDPAWPARFLRERALLEDLLAPWLAGPIEHIGSTAVPGMLAKPVIDIMAPVGDLEASRPAIAAAEAAGYAYFPYRAESMHWFCKPSAAFRTHHLHLVPRDSRLWRERLAFRDRLRADPLLAAEYAALKVRLARQHPRDREAYTDGKAPFVRRVVAETLLPGAGDATGCADPGRRRYDGPGA